MPRRVYTHLVQPENYRDYTRRYVRVPTWRTFEDRMHCTSIRMFSERDGQLVGFRELLDVYTEEVKLGRVIWPNISALMAGNFRDLVDELKERGLYLFNMW